MIALAFPSAAGKALAAPVPDYSGTIQRWDITENASQITYYIDPSAASITDVITIAASEWSSVPTSYAQLVPVTEASQAQILFTVASELEGGSAAGEATWSASSSGSPLCTAAIASDVAAMGSAAKVTVLHETGHCLGLTHSVVSGAVMSYRPGSDLSSDDKYAVTLLYPKGSSAAYPMGCAAVHGASGPGRNGDGALSLALVILLFALGGFAGRRYLEAIH